MTLPDMGGTPSEADERHETSFSGQARLEEIAGRAGLRRIDLVAWRDLDDAEAGGSELHAHEILRHWAAAGIDVRQWTSRVDGAARAITRDGYTVNRRAGRYAVFPRTGLAGLRSKIGTGDGLVEIRCWPLQQSLQRGLQQIRGTLRLGGFRRELWQVKVGRRYN